MEFSVSILRRSLAFRVTIALFVFANACTWVGFRFYPPPGDKLDGFGFPFPVILQDGMTGLYQWYLLGFLLDLVIALTVAVVATWIAGWFRK